ncbi:MTCL1-like protein [Mya arenaria]|uniref:MTCL1-like protein n=2 Tax=Mya arenaria TaxID=6604 RepID=A0ABY7F2M1_MYAAR|nr:MTCL1-like protein [Mya arenaria]
MSEEEKENTPAVCERFEAQAWRKICKNCFQPPDKHSASAISNGHQEVSIQKDTKGAAATSIKDKYEQLEREKDQPRDLPHTLPRTKGKGGLASLTEKYNELDMKSGKLPASPSGNIPPPVFPKTFKRDGDGGLQKSKFGSVENISITDIDTKPSSSIGIKNKFKFGSMENISDHGKKKDASHITISTSKFGGSSENISGSKASGAPSKDKSNLLNKLDAFQSELKSGSASKAGPTVIHKQKDGNVEIINLPPKGEKDSKGIRGDIKDKSSLTLDIKGTASNKTKEGEEKGKIGFKSVFEIKSPVPENATHKSPRDLLSPTRKVDKTIEHNKTEEEVPKKGLLGKSQDQLKHLSKDKDDTSNTLDKNKFNLKDQLKSPSHDKSLDKGPLSKIQLRDQLKSPSPDTDKSPLSKFKDRLLSPTAEKDNLSWKDKLKSSPKESSTDLKHQLKSPSQTADKKPDLKPEIKQADTKQSSVASFKDQLKSKSERQTSSENTESPKLTDLKGQLKPKTAVNERVIDTKLGEKDDKKKGFSFKDQLKSNKEQEADKSKTSFKDRIKSPMKDISTDHSTPTDNRSKVSSFKDRLKSHGKEEEKHDDKKTPSTLDNKKAAFNIKDQLKSSKSDKDTSKDIKDSLCSTQEKRGVLNFKDQLKSSKSEHDKTTDKPKTLFEKKDSDKTAKPFELKSLKKSDDSDKAKPDEKAKFHLPALKSKEKDSKFGNKDLKDVPEKKDSTLKNKFEVPKLKEKESKFGAKVLKDVSDKKESEPKNKFEVPKLKSSRFDKSETEKKTEKDEKPEPKTLFGKGAFKTLKAKDNSINDSKVNTKTDNNVKVVDKHEATLNDKNQKTIENTTVRKIDDLTSDFPTETKSTGTHEKGSDVDNEKDNNKPQLSDISNNNFERISTDTDTSTSELSDSKGKSEACAQTSSQDQEKSPLHVDTQVFTSSRSKTAGVSSLADIDSVDSTDADNKHIELSGLEFIKSPLSDSGIGGDSLTQNGDISGTEKPNSVHVDRKPTVEFSEDEIKKLKEELINMTERCQNLEKENEILSDGLKKKESSLQEEKQQVEDTLKDLREQLTSMQGKCSRLEADNLNLLNDKGAVKEPSSNKPDTDERMDEGGDERGSAATAQLMEDMIEENEALKDDIKELKAEMEEMYDSFRDQEAEEFRELQKELDFTAKNCRILQFKLRKMERRNEQLESDRGSIEDRMRSLQSQFADRDAVAHIRSLEDELRMSKEMAVRLHDELDVIEERRGKVEEENRHLTELLEQADRKQFRLELEVDKLRDKVVDLRSQVREAGSGGTSNGEPRKD